MLRQGVSTRDRPEGALPPRAQAEARARKAHVCFVAPFGWPVLSGDAGLKLVGGAEVQQAILARVLRRNGHRVSMITLDFGQPDGAEVDGIVVHKVFRLDEGIPVLRFLHPRLTSMWRAMSQVDADVYYQRSASMLTAIIAEFCRRNGKRSIYAGASDRDFIPGRQQIQYRRDRWLYEHGLRTVDRIVVQNLRQLEDARVHYGREAVLIPSCYELPAGRSPEPLRAPGEVLWVGTIHDYKRPEIFLDIAARLPQRRFVIVGGSAAPGERLRHGYFEKIQAAAAKLPNVEFTGFLPLAEVERRFDRAAVFVNTSVYEGMPNTFMQAWARGIPTVATVDVGARLEDSPFYRVFSRTEEAVEEIERLFGDPDYRARASAACRGYFEASHSSSEVLARYERLLGELTA